MADLELIDLGGDITLLVGGNEDSKVRIRASKAILCLASDSFRDLVDPHSDEDEVMRAGEDIEFDDDDPEAFTILMKILHMRNDFPTPRPAEELLALALIAEKYDCVQAIRLDLRELFPHDIAQYNMHALYDLIAATYILDHAELFWQFTKELLEDFVASEASVFRLSTLSSSVPSLLWRKSPQFEITNRKHVLMYEITVLIENRRSRILQAILSYQAGLFRLPCMNTTRGTCPIGSMYYQRVADIAETIGLGYFTSQETITMMVSRIERMHGAYIETPASTFPCMIPYEQHTFIADEPFQTFWNTITNLSRGVCLDCFKAGRLWGHAQADCRVEH